MILAGPPSHLPPPPFPPFAAFSHLPPRNHASCSSNCHPRPVIGVFRLVARSCLRGAPNEEQRRHDGSRLALNARSCQAFLHTFASPPERQDSQKIKLHRCTISPLFNGARQPHCHSQASPANQGSCCRLAGPCQPGNRPRVALPLKGQMLHVGDSALGHRALCTLFRPHSF